MKKTKREKQRPRRNKIEIVENSFAKSQATKRNRNWKMSGKLVHNLKRKRAAVATLGHNISDTNSTDDSETESNGDKCETKTIKK